MTIKFNNSRNKDKKIKFTKMQGLGNDFVVFDAITNGTDFVDQNPTSNNTIDLSSGEIKLIADRHFGIGADQILLLEASSTPDVDFFYRVYNADGTRAYQCGNGVRCIAKYVFEKGLTQKKELIISAGKKTTQVRLQDDGYVTVDIGEPNFDPGSIPFLTDSQALHYYLKYQGTEIVFGAVSLGNPHIVLKVPNLSNVDVNILGAFLGGQAAFPQGVNVNFMEVIAPNHIKLRTFERGSGETLACGSGACAAVAIGKLWGWLDDKVTVEMAGGNLQIFWTGPVTNLLMTGPAVTVFEGEFNF